ncbi:MAG: hypothetical protein ABJB74_12085 [Gemmatimonas sp.]
MPRRSEECYPTRTSSPSMSRCLMVAEVITATIIAGARPSKLLGQTASVRDSAGLRIVANPAPLAERVL